jgi:hypothetical protein
VLLQQIVEGFDRKSILRNFRYGFSLVLKACRTPRGCLLAAINSSDLGGRRDCLRHNNAVHGRPVWVSGSNLSTSASNFTERGGTVTYQILDKYLARTSRLADSAIAKFENIVETDFAK